MIALLEAHRAGLLARAHWLPNGVAGVIVSVVALPLSMAFAIASGARPEQGLYTAIVAGALVSMLGGSRMQIAGPIFFGAVEKFQHVLLETHADPRLVVIRLNGVPFADMTGIRMLEDVVTRFRERGVAVIFCEANDRVLGKLQRAGLIVKGDGAGYAPSLREAISARSSLRA